MHPHHTPTHTHACRAPRRVPRVLSTTYPQVKRAVGNERTSQSRQAVEQRKAAGTDEKGRYLPVTVTDGSGQEKTLDGDWHTQAQAGRTSESVSPARTSTRSTHTQHAQSQQFGRVARGWLREFVAGAIVQWHRQHTHAHTQAHTHTHPRTRTLAVHPAE